MLTNAENYYKTPQKTLTTVDTMFRIHENATLKGYLKWIKTSKSKRVDTNGNIDGRHAFSLNGSYQMHWYKYSTVQNNEGVNENFMYCVSVIH